MIFIVSTYCMENDDVRFRYVSSMYYDIVLHHLSLYQFVIVYTQYHIQTVYERKESVFKSDKIVTFIIPNKLYRFVVTWSIADLIDTVTCIILLCYLSSSIFMWGNFCLQILLFLIEIVCIVIDIDGSTHKCLNN